MYFEQSMLTNAAHIYMFTHFSFCLFAAEETTEPEITGCYYNGVLYLPGESYKIDCNTCFCTEEGLAACTKMFCLQTPRPGNLGTLG